MKLYERAYGEGEPLIILHGLFGASSNWHTMSKRLAARFSVHALDLRNHGESPHSSDFNYAIMAEDVVEFAESQGLDRFHMLGHSMGGKVAMQIALRYSDLVEKLLVVDIAPRNYAAHHTEIITALTDLDLDVLQTREEADAKLSTSIPDDAVRQFLLKNLTRDPDGRFQWQMNLRAISQNYQGMHDGFSADRTFSGPALFVRGEASDYIQDADEAAIEAFFPHSAVVTIPGAGHWVHIEAPDAFAQIALDFFTGEAPDIAQIDVND